jgi:hypothetical protein
MKPQYIATGLIAFLVVFGWNAFLIQRDKVLFEAYNQPITQQK